MELTHGGVYLMEAFLCKGLTYLWTSSLYQSRSFVSWFCPGVCFLGWLVGWLGGWVADWQFGIVFVLIACLLWIFDIQNFNFHTLYKLKYKRICQFLLVLKIIFLKPGPPSGPVNGTVNHIYRRHLSHTPMTWNPDKKSSFHCLDPRVPSAGSPWVSQPATLLTELNSFLPVCFVCGRLAPAPGSASLVFHRVFSLLSCHMHWEPLREVSLGALRYIFLSSSPAP